MAERFSPGPEETPERLREWPWGEEVPPEPEKKTTLKWLREWPWWEEVPPEPEKKTKWSRERPWWEEVSPELEETPERPLWEEVPPPGGGGPLLDFRMREKGRKSKRKRDSELQEKVKADYAEALKQGEFPAAYVRLMFLGEGGSGKSSLLDGLMNNPFKVDADSTILADTRSVSYQWIEAADAVSDAWKPHSEEDQVMVLAAQAHQVVKVTKQLASVPGLKNGRRAFFVAQRPGIEATKPPDQVKHYLGGKFLALPKEGVSNTRYAEAASRIQTNVFEEIISQALHLRHSNKNPDVMNVWDCGGQPVFLDIVPAFLTSRTMFLLLFNASLNLDNMYKEIWQHGGKSFPGREQNVSRRQLMMQWMKLIHASLVAEDEVSQYSQSKASNSPAVLPKYPKAMIIGTHGDQISSEKAETVLQSLKSTCYDTAFSELIVDMMVVDNTTSGSGELEDPGYKQIRSKIHDFAQSLMVPTPLAWGAFRRAMQKAAAKSPVLTYGQSSMLAEQCGISNDKVPSVLHFYHQLGAMLHYSTIHSLANTVIAEPKWLIEQLQKLLMPDWYCKRPMHLKRMWKWLEERGVLVEEFYQEIWWDCGLEGGPQALADLLDHFDLAKKISQCPSDMQQYKGMKYFMPCMLKAQPKCSEGVQSQNVSVQQLEAVQKTSTLHIVFKMGYVPPGFFVRVVAQMTDNEQYTPLLNKEVYRDSITFQYNRIDRVMITESLQSIQIKVRRVSMRTSSYKSFAESCVSLRKELLEMCKEVLHWLPYVEFDFAFMCTCSDEQTQHFAILKPECSQDTPLFCTHDRECKVSQQDKFWLPLPALMQPHICIEDGPLTPIEIENVSREVERDVEDLVREMEMEYSLHKAKSARQHPSRGLAYIMISDFAASKEKTRYELAQYLQSAKLLDTSQKLLRGEMRFSADLPKCTPRNVVSTCQHRKPNPATLPLPTDPASTSSILVSTSQLKKHDPFTQTIPTGFPVIPIKKQDPPTMPLLLSFPASADGRKLNIISGIGTFYISFGLLLLEDDKGNEIYAIEKELQKNASDINNRILYLWLNGKGKQPVTWETLIGVMKQVDGLQVLACDIENCFS